jgi:hypothetical protein
MGLPAELSSCPKAKMTQELLKRNVTAFINAKDWPLESPDLNLRDYKLWAVVEDMACQKHHNNLDSLKRSLVKAAAEIPLERVRAVTAEWLDHFKACVEAEGGHFEWHYYKQNLKTVANKLFGSKSVCSVSFSFQAIIYLDITYGSTVFFTTIKMPPPPPKLLTSLLTTYNLSHIVTF